MRLTPSHIIQVRNAKASGALLASPPMPFEQGPDNTGIVSRFIHLSYHGKKMRDHTFALNPDGYQLVGCRTGKPVPTFPDNLPECSSHSTLRGRLEKCISAFGGGDKFE